MIELTDSEIHLYSIFAIEVENNKLELTTNALIMNRILLLY